MLIHYTPTERRIVTRHALRNAAELCGRILLVTLFLLSGIDKIGDYGGTARHMAAMGVAPGLLPTVIALDLLGALAVALGWHARVAAVLLGGFTVLSGAIFHADFANRVDQIMFFKNLSIAGAFLLLAANGAGAWSLDARRARRALPWSPAASVRRAGA